MNKTLFATQTGVAADTINHAGGRAYSLEAKLALAKLAMTGVFNNTFYVKAQDQLAELSKLATQVSDEFLAKLIVYAAEKGKMKDMPALLAVLLSQRSPEYFNKVFPRVANGKFVKNFVQMVRSGVSGRKSLGSMPKKRINQWLVGATDREIVLSSVGNAPSLADVIKLTHPAPTSLVQQNLFKWVMGKDAVGDVLPEVVNALKAWQEGVIPAEGVLKGMFEQLATHAKTQEQWEFLAKQATWNQTIKNLNTFQRHGLFENQEMVALVARKLSDAENIKRANVFPYAILAAYLNISDSIPTRIKNALKLAMEISVENLEVPQVPTEIYVDVSGSMNDPITGRNGSATSKVRCIDVAGLMATIIARKNPKARIVFFDSKVRHDISINTSDVILNNCEKLSKIRGGATKCSVTLEEANQNGVNADIVIYISDYESWFGEDTGYNRGNRTLTAKEWDVFRRRNPNARLFNIDVTPNTTSQVPEGKGVCNVGGFSDEVIKLIGMLYSHKESDWVDIIESIQL